MSYWPWYASGMALAAVMVGNWLLMHRMMAVSGRYSAIVDWLRQRKVEVDHEGELDMTADELAAAVREATAAEFGDQALEARPVVEAAAVPVMAPPTPLGAHLLFFGGLVLGGVLSSVLAGGWSPVMALRSERFAALVGHSPITAALVLMSGGVLVGFGTRMATGCTSGHGLCGSSRLQPGSLLATAAFFGTGVLASFALGRLM